MGLQSALRLLFPPQCITCDALVTSEFGLCGNCWRETPFVTTLACDKCGVPLPGEDLGMPEFCDDCLTVARPWRQGRAAMVYAGNGRRLVLALKHGDRLDLVRPAADWLMRAAAPMLSADMIVAPIPLHRFRLLKRRYNQSALLSAALARRAGLAHIPDLLLRSRRTQSQDGRDRDGRFANLSGAIMVHPRYRERIAGKTVLLVDDVMTSGATFAAGADACLAAGARDLCVVALARVAKDA